MRIKSEIYYQYYPLTDPRDLYKLEKIIFGPSWHEMASTEEVSLVSVLRQSKIILKWGYVPDRRKWMCRMSRLSREDQSWDCRDPEHAQNASELPKLPKYYGKEATRKKKTQERNLGWVSMLTFSISITSHVWNLNKRPEIGFATLVSPRGEESTCAVDQMTS